MKIRILDDNFVTTNNLNSNIIDESDNDLITLLDENDIEYEYGYICNDCKEFHTEDELVWLDDIGDYVCEDCLSDSSIYFFCDDCNEWYSQETTAYYYTYNDRVICQHCFDDDYFTCNSCENIFPQNDSHYCDECDEYFCDDCWDEHDGSHSHLYSYHEFNDWQATKTNDEPEPDFYIGHELEIDNGDYQNDAVDLIQNKLNCICAEDGSLSSSGIEIISQPLSYNYMLSQEDNYREVFNELVKNYNYRSHDTDTCGLHFHVTRPQKEEVIDRIILFMETYKEEIFKFSRRKSGETHWCQFLSDVRSTNSENQLKSLEYIKWHKETSDRYMALNLTNYKTIEFRLFKGTLKYETFISSFEFVYNLTKLASDLSIPIEELTWTRVTSMGKFLPKYIEEHDLKSDKIIHDYSPELIIEFNTKKEEYTLQLDNLTRELLSRIKNKVSFRKNQKIGYDTLSRVCNKVATLNRALDMIYESLRTLNYLNDLDDDRLNDISRTIKNVKEYLEREEN